MATKNATKKTRGTPVYLPPWWLREAERKTIGKSLSEIAAEISRVAKREPPWDRSTVGKFLKNDFPTLEMMLAFCAQYELPPPHFVARTYEEAMHLLRESQKYDDNAPRVEVQRRRDVLNAAQEHLRSSIENQTGGLESSDEVGSAVRRRPRGVVRGRQTSS